jgi:hypothetical protein
MKNSTIKLRLNFSGPVLGGTLILPQNQAERLVKNIIKERRKQPFYKNTGFINVEFQKVDD